MQYLRLKFIFSFLVLFGAGAIVVFLYLATAALPLIQNEKPAPYMMHRLEQLITPHKTSIIKGLPIIVHLNQSDLNALTQSANLLSKNWNFRFDIVEGGIIAVFSLTLLNKPFSRYCNLIIDTDIRIQKPSVFIKIHQLRIGQINLPSILLKRFNEISYGFVNEYFPLASLIELIEQLKIKNEQIYLKGKLTKPSIYQLAGFVQEGRHLSKEELSLVKTAYQAISDFLGQQPDRNKYHLNDIVRMSYQKINTYHQKKVSPIKANQMAMMAVGLALGNQVTASLLDPAINFKALYQQIEKQSQKIEIYNRHDLTKHFIFSINHTFRFGEELANAMGIDKEISDFKGSGFSFSDLLADRTGIIFAKHLTSDSDFAAKILKRFSSGYRLESLLPNPTVYPDNLATWEFNRKYKHINSPEYLQLIQQIDTIILSNINGIKQN
jgi:hypothetical protein